MLAQSLGMRRHLLSALLLSLTLSVSTAAAQDAGGAEMLAQINTSRQAQQLPPLARSSELDAIAQAHSLEMSQNGALTHVSDTTGSPEDRVRTAGLSTSTVAENVALHRDASQAQQALLASPPHLANMMSTDSTHVGIGIVQVPEGVFVTQVFAALPVSALPVAGPPASAPPLEAAPVETPPVFGIIPPFVENAIEQTEAAAAPMLEAAPALDPFSAGAVEPAPSPVTLNPFGTDAAAPAPAAQEPLNPFGNGAAAPAPVAPAPLNPFGNGAAVPAPVAPAPLAEAPAAPQTVQVSPEAATGLRQLFDMGLSLLRGTPAN